MGAQAIAAWSARGRGPTIELAKLVSFPVGPIRADSGASLRRIRANGGRQNRRDATYYPIPWLSFKNALDCIEKCCISGGML